MKETGRDAIILELYGQGLSFGDIAKEVQASRNVVAGVVHRSGKANRGGVRRAPLDLTGKQYGRLTVLGRAGNDRGGSTAWHVYCQCGTKKIVGCSGLISGVTNSCGCLRTEHARSVLPTAREALRRKREVAA